MHCRIHKSATKSSWSKVTTVASPCRVCRSVEFWHTGFCRHAAFENSSRPLLPGLFKLGRITRHIHALPRKAWRETTPDMYLLDLWPYLGKRRLKTASPSLRCYRKHERTLQTNLAKPSAAQIHFVSQKRSYFIGGTRLAKPHYSNLNQIRTLLGNE